MLNRAQRTYKLKSTPSNLTLLMKAEEEYIDMKEAAIEEWSQNICSSINNARNIKDKWSEFRKFTKRKENNVILPFIQQNNDVIFEENEKAVELEQTFFKGKHLNTDKFDENFYNEALRQYTEITLNQDATDEEVYNTEIELEELEGAIDRLKKDSAPGSDSFFTELIINADRNVLTTLLYIFNKSWREGKLPEQWKRANIKFLKKPGKSNYNTPSAYRPISLTSTIGKLMERIITSRLEGFVESNDILDKEQEGFRHFRSTTNALLNLTQSVMNGFNEDNFTLAVLIDFEKAFDSVWREGLLVKLHNSGIKGKMWNWIHNFLEERSARCLVNGHEGEWFRTNVGLPQGAVISPLLFNIYVKDLFQEVRSDKCKFADDSTIWNTGNNIKEMTFQTQNDLNKISTWSRKWRINLNVDKTEYCIFSRQKSHPGQVFLQLGNKPLKYNPYPKLLGVTLDEKLNFSQHIQNIERKAGKSLGMLREIRGIANIKTKFLLQIYNSLVGSQFQYASCVWQNGNKEHLNKLNSIQRKGLSIVLGLPPTASLEVMEVMGGVLPLELRREETAIRDIGKVNSYSTKLPIKNQLDNWRKKETPERHITPLGQMSLQAEEMRKETNIDVKNIEPEFEYHGLRASKSPPEYWRNLGSSKTRSKEQEQAGKELIKKKVSETSENAAIAFTDGSCLTNPGPCGAGAVLYIGEEITELKQPVCKRGSILLGELVAIHLVLESIDKPEIKRKIDQLTIFSDSQSAIGVLSLNWKVENHKKKHHV